ncbi:amino acid adenylation domain-containing protein [Chitinophaga oryzae]|uniref:Amino acid adenylation domain-containing protein n=1 Tax=Chitinophaga oryzae TaxID=2725414 RepID=A0AAE7D6X8_9BACT|nr:non-ribosomal peptide synthetase [Chitinophaga oryzae]QJB30481.1 amino acid adenylation domain-containing protein [Chitinophaga oryzae]
MDNISLSLKISEEYWKKKISGPDGAKLAALLQGVPVNTDVQKDVVLKFPAAMTRRIDELCDSSPLLVYSFYATALAILVNRYTGENNIRWKSSPLSPGGFDEPLMTTEGTCVFAVPVAPGKSFKSLFGVVKEEVLNASGYIPWGSSAEDAVVDIMLNVSNITADTPQVADKGSLLFDIRLHDTDPAVRLSFGAGADGDMLSAVLQNYIFLLSQIVEDPYKEATAYEIVSHQERSRLLLEFNDPVCAFRTEMLFVEKFEEIVSRCPDAPAVVCNGTTHTYSGLNRLAERYAVWLQSQTGSSLSRNIVVFTRRSPYWMAAVIGIWKAGYVYVPIDPAYPDDRIALLLQQSGPAVMITEMGLYDRGVAAGGPDIKILDLHACPDNEEVCFYGRQPLKTDLSYIIYTSGSTGTPKGVMIDHWGMMNHLQAKVAEMGIVPGDRVAQNASQGFDISVWQAFAGLISGATTYICPEEVVYHPAAFIEFLVKEKISILELVPTYLTEMLQTIRNDFKGRQLLEDLKILILNAETLRLPLVNEWFRLFPQIPLVNTYGATEVSDDMGHIIMTAPPVTGIVTVMKNPIANFRLYVVDENLKLLPIGVKGEILIAGEGVGPGYYNDPEKTAHAFIRDPFLLAGKCYRTGDLGRRLPNGELEFLGRKDFQVKISGFRVELHEIEVCLGNLPGVEAAVVKEWEDEQARLYLAAYVILQDGQTADDVKAMLATVLPDYMVPGVFIVLDAFPVTQNGKIDRRRLPEPEQFNRNIPHTEAENALEAALLEIWNEVLPQPVRSVTANFFEAGGHSLLAGKLIDRISTRFNLQVTIRSVFLHQTIREYTQFLSLLPSGNTGERMAIRKISRDQLIPLSFGQQRMWYFEQLSSDIPVHNLLDAFLIEGPLDMSVLNDALSILVDRHEQLRTVFRSIDKKECQIIRESQPVTVSFQSVKHATDVERNKYIDDFLRNQFYERFDLKNGPLLRVSVVETNELNYMLVIAAHHIIVDLWSMSIFIRELLQIYSDRIRKVPSSLPEIPVGYVDYTVWQREYLTPERTMQQVEYWHTLLKDAPPLTDIPTDFVRPPVSDYKGDVVRFKLSQQETADIRQMAVNSATTPFNILLANFFIVLNKLSRQEDLVVGTPYANRNYKSLENVIGFFVNTLIFRMKLSEDMTFEDMLADLSRQSVTAMENADIPFEKIIEGLKVQRSESYNPLFQIMFSYQHNLIDPGKVDGLSVSRIDVPDPKSKFDMELGIFEHSDTMEGYLEYSVSLFKRETIRRFVDYFIAMMKALLRNARARIGELECLTERDRLCLQHVNETDVVLPEGVSIPSLFDKVAGEHADSIALIYGNERITYSELSRRVDNLACQLIDIGIQPGDFVGLGAARSVAMVVAQLAVLKAGAAFLPLDMSYPRERIAFMIGDSGIRVLVAEEQFVSMLSGYGCEVIAVSFDPDHSCSQTAHARFPENTPALFYLIYTSGSTGNPKGVMGTQRGAINRFYWQWKQYPYQLHEVGCQKAPVSFGESISELYAPLLAGRSVLILSDSEVKDPYLMVSTLATNRVTRIVLIPSVIKMLIETFPDLNQRLPDLNFWMSSGEALSKDIVSLFRRAMPGRLLLNLYGSSEVSADVTYHECTKTDEDSVPIGRPVYNTQLFVLDQKRVRVPVGIPGELYVGGVNVADGYYKNPQLTAERFVQLPFCNGPAFKTGDMVKLDPDGVMHYLGRCDDQVKVRGARVSPGEIASALLKHPGVRQISVQALVGDNNEEYLCAYVVPNKGHSSSASELTLFLKDLLPGYMIPRSIILIEHLPLLPNGKIDKTQLPVPLPETDVNGEGAPRDYYELVLAGIWESLLSIPSVNIHTDFFDAGGHSLLATKMMNLVYKKFGRLIPLADLFRAPTIKGIAAILREEQRGSEQWESIVAIQTEGSEPPLFFVPGIGGNVLYFYHLSRLLGNEQPFYGLQAKGLDGQQLPPTSVEEIAANYIREIKKIRPAGPYRLGGHSFGGKVAFEMARQLITCGEEVGYLAILDMTAPGAEEVPVSTQEFSQTVWLVNIAASLSQMYQREIRLTHADLDNKTEEQQFQLFKSALEKEKVLPENSSMQQIKGMVNVLKTNEQIRYHVQGTLPVDITVFRASEGLPGMPDIAAADATLGWEKYTTALVRTHQVPGNHHSMMVPPNIAVVAAIISDELNLISTKNV